MPEYSRLPKEYVERMRAIFSRFRTPEEVEESLNRLTTLPQLAHVLDKKDEA